MDAFEIAQLMTRHQGQPPLKIRFGTVAALNSDTTLSVRPDGQEETVPVVRCCHPNVHDRVALLVSETEWLAVSVVGGDRPTQEYALINHKHAATDITSGTLPVTRGGTGVSTKEAIGLLAYPVGAVYISYVSTSPASLFGGTWTAITGRFPYFNAGTATGGSNTHAHDQTVGLDYSSGLLYALEGGTHTGSATMWGKWCAYSYDTYSANGIMRYDKTFTASSMPAYQTLYAWRRTA